MLGAGHTHREKLKKELRVGEDRKTGNLEEGRREHRIEREKKEKRRK